MIALVIRLASLTLQAAAEEDVRVNVLQYVLPLVVILACGSMLGGRGARKKRHSLGPSVLQEA